MKPAAPDTCAVDSSGAAGSGTPGAGSLAAVAFRRVHPGEAVPPPPQELTEWGNNTLLATLLGMCYGASLALRARETATEEVSQQIGGFAAACLGVQTYLKLQRGEARWTDAAVAGAGTAGVVGTLMPRGLPARLRGMALGVGVGAGLGAPLGYAQHVAQQQIALQRPQQEARPAVPAGAAEAAIARLTGT